MPEYRRDLFRCLYLRLKALVLILTISMPYTIDTLFFPSEVEAEEKNTNLITQYPGGSDYLFFGLNGCSRTKFEVVPHYLENKKIIDQQLVEMRNEGQKRLRVVFPVVAPPHDGKTEDPISSAYHASIAGFLSSVKQIGFEQIIVVIGGGETPPNLWHEWKQSDYDWRLTSIKEYRQELINA